MIGAPYPCPRKVNVLKRITPTPPANNSLTLLHAVLTIRSLITITVGLLLLLLLNLLNPSFAAWHDAFYPGLSDNIYLGINELMEMPEAGAAGQAAVQPVTDIGTRVQGEKPPLSPPQAARRTPIQAPPHRRFLTPFKKLRLAVKKVSGHCQHQGKLQIYQRVHFHSPILQYIYIYK